MEIRDNPYEDIDIGGGNNERDRTVEMADIPFDDVPSPLGLKNTPAGAGQVQSVESLGLQLNLNKADKTKKAMPSLARQKNTIFKLGIPALDLSGLKNVKEYKDWYGYSQKLENCIRLLREKTEA